MILPEEKEILASLNATQYGVVLRHFLSEKIQKLEDVRLIPKENMEVEARARQLALEITDELFEFMGVIKKAEKTKNQYL